MSKNRRPPRAASWLFSHLAFSPNNDAMLGDIHEQFARGESRFWFWREVAVAIVTSAWVEILSRRSLMMKRVVISTIVLVAVFSLGYWTARTPFFVREEMPSASEITELQGQRQLANLGRNEFKKQMRVGTINFLKNAIEKTELEYRRTGVADSKARLDALRQRLKEAQRATDNDPNGIAPPLPSERFR